jgi:iron complex outermembrane receptor protein
MSYIQKTGLILLWSISGYACAFAGITDSIHSIREIRVKAERLEQYLIGSSVQEIDSQSIENYQPQSLAELLGNQSLVSVKTYGPGGIAGISIRGGGSHHASVIWNGINIQSPMLGEVNFSTLPVSFIDKACIQYGGSTTLFGSGTATGGIHMSDVLHLNDGLRTDVSTYLGLNHRYVKSGSAGISDYVQSARISYGGKKWASSLKFFFQDNENNFDYRNTDKDGGPYEKLEHGSYRQYGLSQSNKLALGKNSILGTDLWLLHYYREIPSLMSSYEPGITDQTDHNVMYSVYYKYFGSKLNIKIQSGGFYNQVLYEDPRLTPTITNNRSFSSVNIGEFTWSFLSRFQLGLILEYKNERGQSEYYSEWKTRNIVSPVLSVLYTNHFLSAVVSVRKENTDGKFVPLAGSFGFDLKPLPGLSLKGNISKNYTLPTFNNLYWEFDGYARGNPGLKPETGWSYETGIHYSLNKKRMQFRTSAVLFQNNITNWIRWIPDSTGVWEPLNVLEGVTKGLELDASVKGIFGSIHFTLKSRYGYTIAEALESGTATIQPGRQMFYIPKHQGFGSITVGYKNYLAEYSQNFAGKRTFNEAGGTLDPYTTGNLTQQFTITIQEKMKLVVFTRINNIWSTEYQMKKSYATPLRQYIIGIKFMFNQ